MAGLMNVGGATTAANTPMRSQAMASDAPMPEKAGQDEEQANVSPEEQAQYDRFVNNAYSMIYDDKAMPQIVKRMGSGEDPVEALASTAAMVVTALEDNAKAKGVEISPDVLLHGGMEILGDLADLSKEAGGHEYSEAEIEGATYRAMDIYRESRASQGGLHDDAIQQEFAQILEADRKGELGSMMPGLEEHFAGMAKGEG